MPEEAGPPAEVALVRAALDEVLDPCSVGRGLDAGIVDMGLLVALEVDLDAGSPAAGRVAIELRLTSPACTFQLYFDRTIRERLGRLDFVDPARVTIAWSDRFDWSDSEMSQQVIDRMRERIQQRRDLAQRRTLAATAARGA